MEEALEAALSVGLSEAEFWDQTPYLTRLTLRGRGRRAAELALATGWHAERFAREERLSGLAYYLRERASDDADEGDALIAGFAAMHGLKIEEAGD